MIELIYNEEEESTLEEASLAEPKNVKQVGEPREYKKIFIEDFVHTYLLQYSEDKEQKIRIAILLGNSERSGGKRHLYIKSAFPVDGVTEKQGKYYFSENVWGNIYMECGRYFPEQEIMGWFLSRPGFAVENNPVIEETHRTYFSGADKVLFLMEPLEGESAFWSFDGNRFAKQNGYYIYYEKNEAMREFIMEKNGKEKNSSANEKPDIVMANYRKILKDKKAQSEKRKKKAVSYGVKVAAALILFVGAVALKNQTDKIASMEQQLNVMSQEEYAIQASGDEVMVEELPGNVEVQPEISYEEPEISAEPEKIAEQEELPVTEEQEEEPMEEVKEPQEAEETAAEVPSYEEYVVQAGDTLAKISRDFYGTDEKIAEICLLNEIADGDYIQAGEIILLP